MRLLRAVLPAAYPVFCSMRHVRRLIQGGASAELRVLLYHDIAPSEMELFRCQLAGLARRWRFISPIQFERIMCGDEALEQDSLLLTFDDGFISNRMVADQVLSPLGIQAIFFVVTDFIEQQDREAAREFICSRLKAGASPDALPAHWSNMGWADLRHLIQQGHRVGAHTATHERLLADVAQAVLLDEIVGGANRLEDHLDVPVRHFAYPFGDFRSFSSQAMIVAKSRFDFVHSGLRGINHPGRGCFAIRRDSTMPGDSLALVAAFLEGASDWRYRSGARMLETWVR